MMAAWATGMESGWACKVLDFHNVEQKATGKKRLRNENEREKKNVHPT